MHTLRDGDEYSRGEAKYEIYIPLVCDRKTWSTKHRVHCACVNPWLYIYIYI